MGMCEVNFGFEALFYEFMACKFSSVVSGDAFNVSDEWCHHVYEVLESAWVFFPFGCFFMSI